MQTTSLKPLAGLRILVTRATNDAPVLARKLEALGASTIELPMIQINSSKDPERLDMALRVLGEYDWVVFTSVYGVRFVSERLHALGIPSSALTKPRIAAIGPITATELRKLGLSPDFIPKDYISERIAEGMGNLAGKRVLLPRADIASNTLPADLKERGALVDEVVAYHTSKPEGLTTQKVKSILGGVDVVTFTSPSAVKNLAEAVGPKHLPSCLNGMKVACIGPVTANAVKQLGVNVNLVARTHTVDALVEAIANEIRNL